MSAPSPDWAALFWEARGYLGLSSNDPVPKDELVAQAKANGHTDREIQEAFRKTDALENVGELTRIKWCSQTRATRPPTMPRRKVVPRLQPLESVTPEEIAEVLGTDELPVSAKTMWSVGEE